MINNITLTLCEIDTSDSYCSSRIWIDCGTNLLCLCKARFNCKDSVKVRVTLEELNVNSEEQKVVEEK